jgi:hypothetical protein
MNVHVLYDVIVRSRDETLFPIEASLNMSRDAKIESQGKLTEGEGSVRLTSSFGQLVF